MNNTNLYYSSINPLTKLLELLDRFNIKYEDFANSKIDGKIDNKLKQELNRLSGVAYLHKYNEFITGQTDKQINLRIGPPTGIGYLYSITFDKDGDLITNIDASNLYENNHNNDITEEINYFKQFIM